MLIENLCKPLIHTREEVRTLFLVSRTCYKQIENAKLIDHH